MLFIYLAPLQVVLAADFNGIAHELRQNLNADRLPRPMATQHPFGELMATGIDTAIVIKLDALALRRFLRPAKQPPQALVAMRLAVRHAEDWAAGKPPYRLPNDLHNGRIGDWYCAPFARL